MIKQLLNIAKNKKYTVFNRPYELNIWGIRSQNVASGKFDDTIVVFWKDDKNKWNDRKYTASTDPGTYYLNNLMETLGAAILKEGQNLNAWTGSYNSRLGFSAYELVQTAPITIIRDYNRDAVLDFKNGRQTTGSYGINIHVGANPNSKSIDVGQWSAGCQVFAIWSEHQEFTKLCLKHASLYGNKFSYTLVDERARKRAKMRLILNFGLVLLFLVIAYFLYKNWKKA